VVRQALRSSVPPEHRSPARACPALGPWKTWIDQVLESDKSVPRKQRHTARRIWERLCDEQRADVAESTVRAYVGRRRREIANLTRTVTVPQVHKPGEEAEVDFGECYVRMGGELVKCWMFVMRLSASGKACHRIYANQSQEAFLEGHVEAFESTFGGVARRVRYDNLSPAVAKVLKGRDRDETDRFKALRSHYGFDSFFCVPGIEGAHEKGGVEGEVGRFRRAHLVPVPKSAGLAELNEACKAGDLADDARHVGARTSTVGEDFAAEAPHLLALPAEVFDPAKWLGKVRADAKSRVCVRQCYYSVPARLAGKALQGRLGASFVEIYDGSLVVAHHPRLRQRGDQDLVLDHYLEVLLRKPGALAGSVALDQARASGAFSAAHEAYWARARSQLGDGAGTRALCEVLMLHRHFPSPVVEAAMSAALAAGRQRRPQGRRHRGQEGLGRRGRPGEGHRPGAGRTACPRPGRLRRPAHPPGGGLMSTSTMTEQAAEASISAAASALHLPTVRSEAPRMADDAARAGLSHRAYLAEVLSAEVDDREARRRARRVAEARLPRIKRLCDFDISAVPSVNPATFAAVCSLAWVGSGQPLVALGDPGTGKTHILIGLALAAAEAGKKARYVTCAALVNELAEAADERALSRAVGRYGRLDLLCLDLCR
jgi:transposase